MEYVDKIIEIITYPAVAAFLANLVTMFIDDKKVAKASNIIQATVKVLNFLALNVLKNANKGMK